MDIKLFHSALDLEPNAWAALKPGLRQARAWFETSEAYFQSMTHLYLTAWNNGQLQAILPLYDTFDDAYYDVTRSFSGMTHRLLKGQRFLCIGSRLGFEAGVIGDPFCSEQLLNQAVALARSMGVDYLAANFCRAPLPGWEEHRIGVALHTNILRLDGESYSDFLAQFQAKKRYKLKREIQNSSPVFQAPLAGNEARFNALRTVSCHRQGSDNYLEDSYFSHLARTHGDSLVLLASGTGTDWTGANLMLSSGHAFCSIGGGVQEKDHTYFNLMVHEPMRMAYQAGYETIDLGAACDEVKRLRGAEPVPLTSYLRPVSKRCRITMNGVRPLTKVSARLLPRLRRKLRSISQR